MTIPNESFKFCKKCQGTKPLSEFYKRSSGRPHTNCIPCYKARVAVRRNGPDNRKILDGESRSYKRLRAETREKCINAYGGFICVCCGETGKKFLTLDHINNDGGEWRTANLGNRRAGGFHTYRWLEKRGYPQDLSLQVLCMNCQHGKLVNNGVCPHKETCNDYPVREYGQVAGSAVQH